MNTNGPACPKCRQELPYRFAFTFFNPHNFACPHCGARLRFSMFFLQVLVYAMIGFLFTGTVFWFYVITWDWTTPIFIAFLGIGIPLATLVSHFYFWKVDTLVAKGEPRVREDVRTSSTHA